MKCLQFLFSEYLFTRRKWDLTHCRGQPRARVSMMTASFRLWDSLRDRWPPQQPSTILTLRIPIRASHTWEHPHQDCWGVQKVMDLKEMNPTILPRVHPQCRKDSYRFIQLCLYSVVPKDAEYRKRNYEQYGIGHHPPSNIFIYLASPIKVRRLLD